jgi:nucleoid-associated protein YgaU
VRTLVAVIVTQAVALRVLVDMGSASWATVSWQHPSLWVRTTAAADVVAAAVRLVAMVAVAWLLLATLLQVLAAAQERVTGRALRVPGLPPALRRRIDASIAALVVTGALATPVAAAAAPGLPAHIPDPVPVPRDVTASHTEVPTPPRDVTAEAAPDVVHTVVSGDHLWGIAEDRVRTSDAEATTADVAKYWREVVRANPDLPSGDPDLIHPGEQVVLPPL